MRRPIAADRSAIVESRSDVPRSCSLPLCFALRPAPAASRCSTESDQPESDGLKLLGGTWAVGDARHCGQARCNSLHELLSGRVTEQSVGNGGSGTFTATCFDVLTVSGQRRAARMSGTSGQLDGRRHGQRRRACRPRAAISLTGTAHSSTVRFASRTPARRCLGAGGRHRDSWRRRNAGSSYAGSGTRHGSSRSKRESDSDASASALVAP